MPLAIERIVASALGASIGAMESTYFGANLFVFALAMLLLGLISFVLRLEKVGYSYACITLVIIVMIPRAETPWIAAAHRFAEVSLGILVALAVVGVWREERRLFENRPPNNKQLALSERGLPLQDPSSSWPRSDVSAASSVLHIRKCLGKPRVPVGSSVAWRSA